MSESISELDVHRLRKERPELETELIQFFAQAVERFVQTAQYSVLKNLRLTYFFDEEALDDAGFIDATFEELVAIGVFDVCSLPGVSVELIESFVRVLEQLIDGSHGVAENLSDTMLLAPPELEPVQTRGFEDLPYVPLSTPAVSDRPLKEKIIAGPVLNSIEAEAKLLAAFRKIKEHPRAEEFFQHTLSEYWHPDWLRAPFVEALTFKQLSEMKLSNLLDKRTFSQHKTQAILLCVEAVCEKYSLIQGNEPTSALVEKKLVDEPPIRLNPKIAWRTASMDCPLIVRAMAQLLQMEAPQLLLPEALKRVFFTTLSDKEGGLLLLEAAYGEEYVADLIDVDEKELNTSVTAAQRKLQKSLKRDAATEVAHIEQLLQSPAVSLGVLFTGIDTDSPSHELTVLCATAILQSIGATAAGIEDIALDHCWTANEKGFSVIWNAVKAQNPKTKKSFLALCASLLPYAPETALDVLWRESSIRSSKVKSS